MKQINPYPFRQSDHCPCRRRCLDRWPTGQHLWFVAHDATGIYEPMRTPRRMTVVEDTFGWCWWRLTDQWPIDPENGREVVIDMAFNWAIGQGIPYSWFFVATIELVGPGLGLDFISTWLEEFTTVNTCRRTPDPVPIVISDPPNPFWPPGGTIGEVLTLWGGGVSPFTP